MTKKLLSILLSLIMIFATLSFTPLTALAEHSVSSDGLWEYSIFKVDNKTYGVINDYKGTNLTKTIVIPNTIGDVNIVGIKNMPNGLKSVIVSEGIKFIDTYAFSNNDSDLSISLPNSLVYIGDCAFMGDNLSEINFPDSLEAIGKEAFYSAQFDNRDIILPDELGYIGEDAFEKTDITSIYIGKNTDFGIVKYEYNSGVYNVNENISSPFSNCYDLNSVVINDENPYITVSDNAVYTKDMKKLLYIIGSRQEFTIDDSVEEISGKIFNSSMHRIDRIIIGSGLRAIPDFAFYETTIGEISFNPGCNIRSIGSCAFKKARIEEAFVLPKSVKQIAKQAFEQSRIPSFSAQKGSELAVIDQKAFAQSNINNIDFSNCKALLLLGDRTFSGCKAVEVNLLGTAVSSIRENLFENSQYLQTVWLPVTAEYVFGSAFSNCPRLVNKYRPVLFSDLSITRKHSVRTNSEYVYKIYNGADGDFVGISSYFGAEDVDLVIPDTINGKPVKIIENGAFKYKKFNSVTLPTELEIIREGAFEDCGMTGTLILPSGVKYIGTSAFEENAFSSVELNEGLLYIGSLAFNWATEMEYSVSYPESLIAVGSSLYNGAFTYPKTLYYGKNALNIENDLIYNFVGYADSLAGYEKTGFGIERVEVSDDNPYYTSEDGVLYNKDMTELIFYPQMKRDTEFIVPDTVVSIEPHAFEDNVFLEKLTITGNVKYIDKTSFSYASRLKTVIFKSGVSVYKLDSTFYNIRTLENVIFEDGVKIKKLYKTFCSTNLKSIVIPESVTAIGSMTFHNTPLENVVFHEGLTLIDSEAFEHCAKLTKLILPQSMRFIYWQAFKDCTALSYINFGGTKYIQAGFINCTSLEQVDVTGIRLVNAFIGCDNLKKFYFTAEEKEAYIAAHECEGNESVESVVIGSSISEIRDCAFADCTNLEKAVISDRVEMIADSAFDNCEKLTIYCVANSVAHLYALKNNIRFETFSIEPVPDQTYTGKAITPALKVTQGGETMTAGVNYKAVYSDNVNVGLATVSVVGLGDYKVLGTTVNFKIVAPKPNKSAAKPVTSNKKTAVVNVKLAKPVITKKKRTKGKLEIKWKKVNGADGYIIQYSTNKTFKGAKTVIVSANTYKKTFKLKDKKKYYVRIQAFKKSNGKINYSKWNRK